MSDLEQIAYDNAIRALDKQEKLLEELFAFRDDPAELRRRLAYDMQRFWEDNDQRMAPVRRAFRLAASSLVVEVLSLTVLATGIL